jgi:hypothetical protein
VGKGSLGALREDLLAKLEGRAAHISLEAALKGFPLELAGKRPARLQHTAWGLLYHIRICQWDILRFALDPGHGSPPYPSGLWPTAPGPANEAEWIKTVRSFRADKKRIMDMVRDLDRDLNAPMREGLEESLLMMSLLVVDHNSYHIGQLVSLRMLLGVPVKDW